MTTITHYEWLALPYPALGAAAAAAGTVQQCQDGKTYVIWDVGTMQMQAWINGAWTPPRPLPMEPVAFSNPKSGKIVMLSKGSFIAFSPQWLFTLDLTGAFAVQSAEMSHMSFPTYPANVGTYVLENNGKQCLFHFDDDPFRVWVAYQDLTGKSCMVGWFIPNVIEPEILISFDDSQVGIQLVQQGSQKGNPTLFGEPAPMMGFPRGWLFNKNLFTIGPPAMGCRLFAPADGWGIETFPHTINFGSPVVRSWPVQYQHYGGNLFDRDPIVTGLEGYATGIGAGIYPGNSHTIVVDRAWATFRPGAPLAEVDFFPFNPATQALGFPLAALPPAGLGTNWHPALLFNVPFLLDDAGHWVYLGLVSFTFSMQYTVNWSMFETIKKGAD